jgi:capsular exopolysaccharide synthesis family protein
MNNNDKNIWEDNSSRSSVANENNRQQINSLNSIDIDLRRIISIWPFIILFGLLGYAAGSIYMRYATSIFTVSTSISIQEKEEVTLGQVFYGSSRDPFNDRIAFFKSPALATRLVDSLGLEYDAEAQGRFRNNNFYNTIKWQIITNTIDEEVPEINFSITPKNNAFHYVSGKVEGDAKWGEKFLINSTPIIIYKLKPFNTQSPIFCHNTNRLAKAFELSRDIEITTSKESNIINIKYSDVSNERAINILKCMVRLYNNVLEQDKSLGYSQAISFIEQRMAPLRSELDSIENSLAAFKASRGIVDVSASGGMYLQKMQDYDKELTNINILQSTISAVEDFISNPSMKDADLAFVGVDNPGLQTLLNQYQQLRLQRDKLALTAQETNPSLILLNKNIADLKGNMENQLKSYKKNLKIAQQTYQEKIGSANSMLKKSPIEEKELLDKTRFQNIKEQLYLTLLQKREEAAIAKASVTIDTKVLYPPVKSNSSIKPSKLKVFLSSILIGLILPIIFALIKEILNRKIISKKHLQSMTNISVLAELEQSDSTENFPFITEGSQRSMFGEQIRSLRTSINFYLNTSKSTNYIVITSSVSGEGKSFLTMNLAKSYSLQGKKVAMLEFDLRRPKISKAVGHSENKIGLSSLLLGKISPKDIIVPISKKENEILDLFPSGMVPPNPQELISSKYMKDLKAYLDENYDMVVVDTPPYGIVADAQILGEWADLSIIVTRFQQTVKEQVQEINEWNDRGVFKSMAIVFNGVKNSGYFGYKYGYYYYKRKYGYSYYSSSTTDKSSD